MGRQEEWEDAVLHFGGGSQGPPPAATAATNVMAAMQRRLPVPHVRPRQRRTAATRSRQPPHRDDAAPQLHPEGPAPRSDLSAPLSDRLEAFLGERLPSALLPVTDTALFGPRATSTSAFLPWARWRQPMTPLVAMAPSRAAVSLSKTFLLPKN